jgi:D-glucuronyl C5-epimerase C-terminus
MCRPRSDDTPGAQADRNPQRARLFGHTMIRLGAGIALIVACMALGGSAEVIGAEPAKPKRPDPVRAELQRLEGTVPQDALAADRHTYTRALATLGTLRGTRRRELRSVVSIVRGIAARGRLTSARLPLVFLTLQRNVEWWSTHGPPAAGSPGEKGAHGRVCKPLPAKARAARLSFPGSTIVWQYYPGLGLQLQVNGTFAAANGLLQSADPAAHGRAAAILDEMRPLAIADGGVTTWEYLFPFGGGKPPWRSGLSQATAIRAYLQGAAVLGRPELRDFALQLASLFAARPPKGVALRLSRDGTWYALYSFAPRQQVLNAQLNAVIALRDLEQATGDARVHVLAREGLRATRRRISRFDTGTWSRYSWHGPLADLNYHVLNRDLARQLCDRTGQGAICRAAGSFARELDRRCPRRT